MRSVIGELTVSLITASDQLNFSDFMKFWVLSITSSLASLAFSAAFLTCSSDDDSGLLGAFSSEFPFLIESYECLIFSMAPFTSFLVPATASLRFSSNLSSASDAPSLTLLTNPLNLSFSVLGVGVVSALGSLSTYPTVCWCTSSFCWCCWLLSDAANYTKQYKTTS